MTCPDMRAQEWLFLCAAHTLESEVRHAPQTRFFPVSCATPCLQLTLFWTSFL